MEGYGSNVLKYDDDEEEKALKGLLDAFRSTFSLDEIASAYCKAGRNVDLAGEILYDMQGSNLISTTRASNGEAKGEESSKSSYNNNSVYEKPGGQANGKPNVWRPKGCPVSGGTVSSVLGKDYIRSTTPSVNGSSIVRKPLKLDSKVMPMSELWEDEAKSNSPKYDRMHQDMEDFLFKLLGDGFKLDRDVIHEVLDNCGYDMQKSMEKLLDRPAVTLEKRSKFVGESTEKFKDMDPKVEVRSHQRKLQYEYYPGGNANRISYTSGVEPPEQLKERNDLQKEVLVALFNAPERPEKLPRKTVRVKAVKRTTTFGQVVDGPPIDFIAEHETDVSYPQKNNEDDVDEDDGYQDLRKAVKEYRGTMKEYYQAAVDAFVKGDHVRAGKLMQQGRFFHKKAYEADEESNQKILESRNVEGQDEMLLDLHEHGAKEAVRLLKSHLSSLSGIASFKYLKVIIETNDEDITKGSRRRLVMKLLEKESIKWTEEEGNAGTILIRLDNINRRHLSFVKK